MGSLKAALKEKSEGGSGAAGAGKSEIDCLDEWCSSPPLPPQRRVSSPAIAAPSNYRVSTQDDSSHCRLNYATLCSRLDFSCFVFSLTSISIFPVGAQHTPKSPPLPSFDFRISQQPKFQRFDCKHRAQFSTPAPLFPSLPLALPCLRFLSRRPSCIFASFHWAEAVEHFALQPHALYAARSPTADGANSGLTVCC